MIKRMIYGILTLPGALMILLVVIAKKLTDGFDSESIDIITDYAVKLDGFNGIAKILDSDVGLLFLMYKINEYSYIIATVGVIWIIIFVYLIENNRRLKFEKKNKH